MENEDSDFFEAAPKYENKNQSSLRPQKFVGQLVINNCQCGIWIMSQISILHTIFKQRMESHQLSMKL